MDHPLKVYRTKRGLNQSELAELLGVTKTTISRWEKGKRAPRNADIWRIAIKTGLAPSDLLRSPESAS